jgi:pimeloyl-ACP methyl ester carboxylesterase
MVFSMMDNKKISVYFMPGLAASSLIFERIALPQELFEIHLLDWELPTGDESLQEYAKRMAEKITAPNPVLIGVSFGGILVQEMAAFLNPLKVIIISSVKSNVEFPRRMKIAKTTKAYKLIPTSIFSNIEKLSAFSFGKSIAQRLKLYERYLSVRDVHYLDWAIERIVLWDRTQVDSNVIHIHGDADEVFPIQYIKDCVVVKGGTHIMILSKYKWFNENLPALILGEFSK